MGVLDSSPRTLCLLFFSTKETKIYDTAIGRINEMIRIDRYIHRMVTLAVDGCIMHFGHSGCTFGGERGWRGVRRRSYLLVCVCETGVG